MRITVGYPRAGERLLAGGHRLSAAFFLPLGPPLAALLRRVLPGAVLTGALATWRGARGGAAGRYPLAWRRRKCCSSGLLLRRPIVSLGIGAPAPLGGYQSRDGATFSAFALARWAARPPAAAQRDPLCQRLVLRLTVLQVSQRGRGDEDEE